jgi:hypothetical protein
VHSSQEVTIGTLQNREGVEPGPDSLPIEEKAMADHDWTLRLSTMSADNLLYEKGKRISELEFLRAERSRMRYQEDLANDEWEQSVDRTSNRKPLGRHFDPGGFQTENDLSGESATLDTRIDLLERELQDIDGALRTKASAS